MEQTKEKKYIVGSILCGLLTAFGIAATAISLIGGSNGLWVLADSIGLAFFVLIGFYAFIGYKKPHGNLLKYIILVRTLVVLSGIPTMVQLGNTINILALTVEIGLMCYVAGRLAKAKENLLLMLIITVCEVICHIPEIISGDVTIGVITPLIIWLDICVAYFLRYKQHREAGLEDEPKSK